MAACHSLPPSQSPAALRAPVVRPCTVGAVGDHAGAKHWSQQGKEHAAEMELCHSHAAEAIYSAANVGRPTGEVDLHGLRVKEAAWRVVEELGAAKRRGDRQLLLIVVRSIARSLRGAWTVSLWRLRNGLARNTMPCLRRWSSALRR